MLNSTLVDRSSWYLDDEAEMGEGRIQRAIIRLLLELLEDLAQERGWTDYVLDSDQYIAWVEDDPNIRVAPDIYLLWDPASDPWVDSWQTWRPGHPTPVFALEVVSYDWHKDYVLAPEKYDSLGVDELIVFDPKPHTRPRGQGKPVQLWRRNTDGHLQREPSDRGAWSTTFGVFFVPVDTEDRVRLRLASTLEPLELLPTPEERRNAQQRAELEQLRRDKEQERAQTALESAEKERERAEKERERAEKERERAEKERERAEKERERAEKERLLALLREHGIDPPST